MLQFHILSGSKSGQIIDCKKTPVRIGRGSLVDVALPDPGVWEEHLEVTFEGLEIQASVVGSALAAINGNPFQTTLVRNGDLIAAGGATFRIYLQPAEQKPLKWREGATWAGVLLIIFFQILLIAIIAR